ncbi:hypothetical protein B0H16DRAFT_1471471 [Mycena metata]|uniref:Uncharacterized protein n=1 Tax=Mycena metata TaxID=1033252 RepID=A0AAD7HQW5_9AGAR|nr:hypothetical protein B0H16DRAFT_1471471 [Mycena metata]
MDNKMQLEQCVDALNVYVKMFDTEIEATTLSSAVQMKTDTRARHKQFLALLESHPHLDSSTSQTRSTISTYGSSSDFLSLLPVCPQAGDLHDPELVERLLQLTGDLPLALTLMAHVAATDDSDHTLRRWIAENTRLLFDGYDHTSRLDISVASLYTGLHMTSGAKELLSLLPDGISDADLVQSRMNIPNILTCKTTLIQTSLAHVDQHRALEVLAPIREYISRAYPAKTEKRTQLFPQSYIQLQKNLANFNCIFLDALATRSPDIEATLESIVLLREIGREAELESSSDSVLMVEVCRRIEEWGNRPVYARYFHESVSLSLAEQNQLSTLDLADALHCMGQVSRKLGQYPQALGYLRKAQQHLEILGNVIRQTLVIMVEANAQRKIGDLRRAVELHRKAQTFLPPTAVHLRDDLKDLHLQKTEYLEAKAYTDLAEVGIAIDLDAVLVLKSLATARTQITQRQLIHGHLGCDIIAADLSFRDGDLTSTKRVFEDCLPQFHRHDPRTLFCAERLADISHRSSDRVEEIRWNGVCVALAFRHSNRLSTMNALRQFAALLDAWEDQDTTLALLSVVLVLFEAMGVHQRVGECRMHIASILESRGELRVAIDFLEAARPAFERSSQEKKGGRGDFYD